MKNFMKPRFEVKSRMVYLFPNATKTGFYVEENPSGHIVFASDAYGSCVSWIDSFWKKAEAK